MANLHVPQSVDEVEEIVRRSIESSIPIEPIGGGTQIHVGHECSEKPEAVSLLGMNSVVDYAPNDLVVVAQAGMRFAELQSILSEHRQTLPLEVALPDRQTLGGIVASRANSLTRAANGSVRDWLIGCKLVGGEGERLVGGGKVVKNVAGYDLPKLYCGSWGTLGILYEVAFKLAPAPGHSKQILVTLNAERNSEEVLDRLHAESNPTFAYLLSADSAQAILGADAPPAQFLAIGFDGHAEAVEALAARAKLAMEEDAFQILDLTPEVGARLRSLVRDLPAQAAPLTVRCNILPSQVGAFARMLEWTARKSGFSAQVFADTQTGVIWAHMFPRDSESAEDAAADPRWMRLYPDLRDKIDRVGGSAVFERMPKVWRDAGHPVWSPVLGDVAWMRQLKSKLDPHGIFRPGRYVDRI